jgi:hypothetical protein
MNNQPGATTPTYNTTNSTGTNANNVPTTDPNQVGAGVVAPGAIGPNGIEPPNGGS